MQKETEKHSLTIEVIAVLGSWHKIASVRDYLVTILNFLGFIASQSKKKDLKTMKVDPSWK